MILQKRDEHYDVIEVSREFLVLRKAPLLRRMQSCNLN